MAKTTTTFYTKEYLRCAAGKNRSIFLKLPPCDAEYAGPIPWLSPILVNAGTEYYYTLQMLSNETMRNCLLNREPFLGCDQSWKVQGWLKNWIFCISFDTKF